MIGKYIALDNLIKARMVSLQLSGILCAITGGFAAKALAEVMTDRKTIANMIPGGKIACTDIIASSSTMLAFAIVGVGISIFALILVYFEQRGNVSASLRVATECALGFICLGLLGSVIATTYICLTRQAHPSAPGFTEALLTTVISGMGRSLHYRATKVYIAMIVAWFCCFFLFLDLVLLIAAGLRYRKADAERRANANGQGTSYSDDAKAGSDSPGHLDRV